MRLITFPGQGTPISLPILKALVRNKEKEFQNIIDRNGPRTNDLLQHIYHHPSSPGSIAVCSNLLYQLYNRLSTERLNKIPTILLGHSLGELTALSINSLFSINDLFKIANYRNELMIKYTEKYLLAHKMNLSTKFEMWAISSPNATNLANQINNLLQSLKYVTPTISIANVNSMKQCVVTGLIEDLEKLRIECQTSFPKLRITELTNPDNLAFHNNTVLGSIQEPLYDYIWDVLKLSGTNVITNLDYPIISNLDGNVSSVVHFAIEKFVKCSSHTVQFTKCYDTINFNYRIDQNVLCMGPGNVIFNLIRRNCNFNRCFEYSSLATIDEYHNYKSEIANL
ncbi:hypothetical protein KAFR_0G01830 [Kazachstania africana CBS 2517]|uniref:[acyl-carrier-protein] S-malonyltransferase n=1 Tax=Kazachstania africana (strain ATCC 22294 / BCRC 22015 / CBS 2517 / CECT 1963 / NBRC 1671 / NRRL Y-8276) TaxID=1071382 RepID=H2AXW7_KAZAF|nr:hypothetical protein KAFR_0G01830 [Kazachstania africana CBS 2517]CCF59217.1 hypothetical protein KAFR_0G01830 [Kazachstania africana CBS 2517]